MSSMKLTVAWILREFYIFLGFSWRDLSATIVPASIFTVGAMRSSNLSFPLLVSSYTLLFSWLISYVYFFNISNQITGLEEDRVNKPDRPIPSGMVTMEGAKLRWILALAAFLGVAVYEPILFPETICWVITAGFLSLTSAGNHWLGKNCIALTIGT
ncbi:hypothetical protein Hypma_000227 [Hypsizygus marmoreus]|uniref:Uncharacterized protein n=1 Tax=Hypsizygus marmoreus TaxID=39966 RepID=A0A369JDM3_HYPMA|nr:hypothetical protein Hypma_000227 [Hypsizygus marmoreus]